MSGCTRWGLRNIFLSVSLKQFKKLAAQFQEAVERDFGTDVQLTLTALSQPPLRHTTYDAITELYYLYNDENTILRATSLEALTPEAWKQAAYVRITLNPIDASKAPSFAFAGMEGKGCVPKKVTFYAQPANELSAQTLSKKNPLMRLDDGYNGNAINPGYPPVDIFY